MKTIKAFLYTVCLISAMVGIWNLWGMNRLTARTTELYDSLAEVKTVAETTAPTLPDDISAGYRPIVNPWLEDVMAKNPDTVAWITVEGTNIDYPVMQTREDNDYYLNHDFNRQRNIHGTPFLDVGCRLVGSDNLIIYGHHMQDNTIFQNLTKFRNPAFCESHGSIRLDTVEESREYQVVFVMVISVREAQDFPYHQRIDFADEADFRDFLTRCGDYAVWKSETLPEPGTKLLTLSTCEYSKQNGRLVVVARETDAG